MNYIQKAVLVSALVFLTCAPLSAVAKARVNDYPTHARSQFVFACMASNEMDRNFLKKCSCAIDVIAARLSYEDYEKAEAILRLQLGTTPREEAYQSVGIAKAPLEKLFRAQAASEIECF